MSWEKIEFVGDFQLNNSRCGCCSYVIVIGDSNNQINSSLREIFSLLFENFMLSSDVICDECLTQLTNIHKFRVDVIARLSELVTIEPKVKIEELEDETEETKPLAFDFRDEHNYDDTYDLIYDEPQISKRNAFEIKRKIKKTRKEVNDGRRKGGITYNCSLCKSFTSDNKKDYAEHILDLHAINHDKKKEENKSIEDSRVRMIETRALPEPMCSVQCDYCGNIFKTKKILYGHMKSHIPPEEQVKCIECEKVFRDLRIMIRHRNHYHGNGVKFWCYCGNEFDNARDLNRCRYAHGRKSIPKKTNDTCDECEVQKSFNGTRQLLNHKNKYHGNGKRFWCIRCGALYESKEQQSFCIKSHYNDVLKDILVKCPECDKELLHNSLKIHLKSVHSQVREIVCHECGKAFCATARLTVHMRQVHNNGLKPFLCDICGRNFAQKKALRDHMNKVHTKNRRQYECPICWKVCFENPERHLTAVHPNGHDNGVRANKETNKYHCPKCIQTFNVMKAYEWHVNEKLCENYGEFEIEQNQEENSKKKFGVFTKGKFKCKICNSVQKTLARLRRHQHYVHSGEIDCPVCDKKMKCKRAVIGHLRKVHKTNFTAVIGRH